MNAPRVCPNSWLSISAGVSAAQFDRDQLALAPAQAVNLLGDVLLAGAGLADEQHRRRIDGDPRHVRAQRARQRRLAPGRRAPQTRPLHSRNRRPSRRRTDTRRPPTGPQTDNTAPSASGNRVTAETKSTEQSIAAAEVDAGVITGGLVPFDREVPARDRRVPQRRIRLAYRPGGRSPAVQIGIGIVAASSGGMTTRSSAAGRPALAIRAATEPPSSAGWDCPPSRPTRLPRQPDRGKQTRARLERPGPGRCTVSKQVLLPHDVDPAAIARRAAGAHSPFQTAPATNAALRGSGRAASHGTPLWQGHRFSGARRSVRPLKRAWLQAFSAPTARSVTAFPGIVYHALHVLWSAGPLPFLMAACRTGFVALSATLLLAGCGPSGGGNPGTAGRPARPERPAQLGPPARRHQRLGRYHGHGRFGQHRRHRRRRDGDRGHDGLGRHGWLIGSAGTGGSATGGSGGAMAPAAAPGAAALPAARPARRRRGLGGRGGSTGTGGGAGANGSGGAGGGGTCPAIADS